MRQNCFLVKSLLVSVVFLALCPMMLTAGDGGKTTVQAAVGVAPRAENTSEVMIQTAVVPAKSDEKPIAPPAPRCAGDWVAAWQAAREVCPEGSSMKIFFNDRPGLASEAPKALECVELKARGELLVLICKQPGQKEESAAIIRAGDIVRIEIAKSSAAP